MNIFIGQKRSLGSRWLSIASSSGNNPQVTIEQREVARRSDLIAWLALGLLGVLVIVSPIAIGDRVAALAYLCFFAMQVAVISLNRAGHITLAGIVLVASISAALFAYMWSSPLGLTMGQLPNYDALAVGVVIAASVLPRRSGFIVAAIQSVAIVADYLIRPHNTNVILDAANYPSATIQTISLLVRPIAMHFIFAVVAFLWVRGTDAAIQRADRAEEIAMLEYRELQRTQTMEEGVRYFHQTLAQWAQGNFAPRVPIMPLDILEQVRSDLNAFMERFAPNMDATYYLQRLQNEVHHLTSALDSWVRGRPVAWPEPSGTPLDYAIAILRSYGASSPSFPSAPPAPEWQTGQTRQFGAFGVSGASGTTPMPPMPPRNTGAPYTRPTPQPFPPPQPGLPSSEDGANH